MSGGEHKPSGGIDGFKEDIAKGLIAYKGGFPKAQRFGALYQLSALIQFAEIHLDDRGVDLTPVRHLQRALADLDRGAQDPLLKTGLGHRGKTPTQKITKRARLAAALELLMIDGMPESAAAKWIVRKGRHIPQSIWPQPTDARPNPSRENAISDWREQAKRELPTEDLMAMHFLGFLNIYNDMGLTGRKGAERLLSTIA